MTDEDDRDARLLGQPKQLRGRLLDLGNAAGGRLHILRIHRLDGVDDDQVRGHFANFPEDILHQRLAVYVAIAVIAAQPPGPQLDLTHALFTGYIQGLDARGVQGNLEREGRLADTRLAADEHQRTFHQAPAQKTVQLVVAQ